MYFLPSLVVLAAAASATVLKSLHPTLKPFGLLRADDADFYTAAGFYETRHGRAIVSFKLDPKTGVAATGYFGPLTLRPVGADTWFLTLPLKEKAQVWCFPFSFSLKGGRGGGGRGRKGKGKKRGRKDRKER